MYRDSKSNIFVERTKPNRDVEPLLHGYTYNGRPLIESWHVPSSRRISDNTAVEMRVASLALSRMGISKVSMTPQRPPEPDLFVESAVTGPVAAEVTLDKDPDEAAFQSEMQDFIAYLNRFASASVPVDVNLGFLSVPRKRNYQRVAQAIVDVVAANAASLGVHHFTGELTSLFSQFLLSTRTEQPFSGGGVVNDRGIPDLYASARRQIAEKRDTRDYRVRGRATWLVVGTSLPGLMGPDTKEDLYRTDIELGQFDCIVLSDAADYVTFKRP